jgi:hypothetical protein
VDGVQLPFGIGGAEADGGVICDELALACAFGSGCVPELVFASLLNLPTGEETVFAASTLVEGLTADFAGLEVDCAGVLFSFAVGVPVAGVSSLGFSIA